MREILSGFVASRAPFHGWWMNVHARLGTKLLRQLLKQGLGWLDARAEEEAVALLTSAYELAQQELQPTDELRLACCQAACFALCAVCNDYLQAKVMAEDCFNATHSKAHELTDAAIAILEQIRKHFMMRVVGADVRAPDARHKQRTAQKPRAASMGSNVTTSSLAGAGTTSLSHAAVTSAPAISDPLTFSNVSSPALDLPAVRRAIRAGSGLPVQLDTLPEAAQLLSAMDQIFRLYVRGFALPGQQHDGSSVNLVGQKLAFGAFLLDGKVAQRVHANDDNRSSCFGCDCVRPVHELGRIPAVLVRLSDREAAACCVSCLPLIHPRQSTHSSILVGQTGCRHSATEFAPART